MKHLSSFLKGFSFLLVSLLIFLSLVSYHPADIPFLSYPHLNPPANLIGIGGAYLSFFLFFVFGYAAYFFPFWFFCFGLNALGRLRFWGLGKSRIVNGLAFVFFIIFLSAFIGLFPKDASEVFKTAGAVGFFSAGFFKQYLGIHGAFITTFILMTVNAVLLFGFFFIDSFLGVQYALSRSGEFFKQLKDSKSLIPKIDRIGRKEKIRDILEEKETASQKIKPEIKVYSPAVSPQPPAKAAAPVPIKIYSGPAESKNPVKPPIEKKAPVVSASEGESFNYRNYKLPSPQMLKVLPFQDQGQFREDIKAHIKNLETALSEFGVEAKVVSVQKGPVVTMYELSPQAGTKIQKISSLADDIALAMKSSQVRVVAPIPGRGTVGVEIPNIKKHLVSLREVLEDKTFTASASLLTLVIGKDVAGNPVVADLKEMPHLLIAGTTGAGKTVCVNSLISSILFKAKPDEVKFIMVDPKMVELACFAEIPHLLHPVISEAKKAFIALNWAVEEMERRYRLLAAEGCRNIDFYNKGDKKLPYIIIVVDELADLMVVARENIEATIQRLAQLSRAVGIHLILATQRPSVDVITGVIKANFPARISFKVSSRVDSRTVLDVMGADKLLGKGDLLFLKPGAVKLIRAQGSYVDDEDIKTLADFIKAQGKPKYEEAIVEGEKKQKFNVESDELFDEAVKAVLQARQASASLLQRRLRVGYTRAARLLDLMEQDGLVGPFSGSKAREILVDTESFLTEKGWR